MPVDMLLHPSIMSNPTAILERDIDAAAVLLGLDDSRYDDGDGWVAIGKYTGAHSEFARFDAGSRPSTPSGNGTYATGDVRENVRRNRAGSSVRR